MIGVPDDDRGERSRPWCNRSPQAVQPGAALAAELLELCRTQLATYKCPRSIDFEAELPRDGNGKLYKRLLKDEYWKAAGRSI